MGASGTPDCCQEHETQMPHGEAPPSGQPSPREEDSPMGILIERCAALDVHKDTVVACGGSSSPTADAYRNSAPSRPPRWAAGVGGLAVG
jgi:hypothetical protein